MSRLLRFWTMDKRCSFYKTESPRKTSKILWTKHVGASFSNSNPSPHWNHFFGIWTFEHGAYH